MGKIWQRSIIREILKFTLFSLGAIYLLYIIIDFSMHGRRFLTYSSVNFYQLFLYYLHIFIKRLDMFLPLTFMLGIIKVIGDMNIHNELTALQMAGISLGRLCRPLFLMGALFSLVCLANFEIMAPRSLFYVNTFHTKHLKKSKKKDRELLGAYLLKDGSRIIYQNREAQNLLFDVFWIISDNDVWHAKKLDIGQNPPCAYYADHLMRQENGNFEKTGSFAKGPMENMRFCIAEAKEKKPPVDSRPLSGLISGLLKKEYFSQKEKAFIQSQFYYKVTASLLSMLIVLAITPFCLRFSRSTSLFFITALALVGFIVFFISMDAAMILAENQVFSPFWALALPLLVPGALFTLNFKHQELI